MKHNSHLVMGFIRSSSSTGVTQEKNFTRTQFFIVIFFVILFGVTLSDPYHPLSLINTVYKVFNPTFHGEI